ncbi:MAG TPA: tetratricopeptide repeat protein, partial [Alphaproteobacteria bacterium]|nr:tetratricopeptide repeat protein [Alphaproteobacteria bacterium]
AASGRSLRRMAFLYGLMGVLAFGALIGAVVLIDSPTAEAFARPVASSSAQAYSLAPVEIGVSDEDLLRVKRLEPASGASDPSATPNAASTVPASVPSVPSAESKTTSGSAPVSLPSPPAPPPLPEMVVAPVPAVPPSEDQGASQGEGVTVPPGGGKDDLYYDSLPLPPTGTMAKSAGPRKVNPSLEPAQKFVIVKKTQDAGGLESLLVSANRALALGRYDAALDMFTRLYRKNPRDARILMGRAVSLQYAGRREAAIGAYDEILKLDPSSVEAKINRAGLVGVQYPAVALRDLLALRDQFPGHAGLAAQIGLMQAKLGNDTEAMQYLGAAASLEPRNASHIYNMAVIADRMDDRAKAISLYEQALQLDGGDTQGVRVNRDAIYARLSVLREGKK